MDPGISFPVNGYGGIERVIEALAKEYVLNGHEVHLLVTSGSAISGCIVHDFGKVGFPPKKWDARKAIILAWRFLWKNRNNFDLIHNFGRLIYLLPILNHQVKKIMSYQREITTKNIQWFLKLPYRSMYFTGCSQNLINRAKVPGNWEAIYNTCDFNKYELQDHLPENAPLIFLGRLERVKGCHTAIQVAKATSHKLIIAGNISTLPEEKLYFDTEIAPYIDGKQIQYVGTLNDNQKNEWLGRSKAMLFPIEWNEPFGIVMIEAMACGTPIIAFNFGSVNEVIDQGQTGIKVNSQDEMIKAINEVKKISRTRCREIANQRFGITTIAQLYLNSVSNERKKAVVLSTHQPAANPRAFKEYLTLKEKGWSVKYLYEYNVDWSYAIDEERFLKGDLARQDFIEIGGNPHNRKVTYFFSRLFHKIFKMLDRRHLFFAKMSTSRAAFFTWFTVNYYPAQLYLSHYLGTLPAAIKAATKHAATIIFDAEDFHRGEQSYYPSQINTVIQIENEMLPQVDGLTSASPAITAAYQQLFPTVACTTVNNYFSIKYLQPKKYIENTPLKLFWFSQHIGPHRGLEIFIKALNELPDLPIQLTLMGTNRNPTYKIYLESLCQKPERLFFKDPVSPDKVFHIASEYDIGLAGEVPNCLNKILCLSNKIFTYLLAGNAILASDMQGQKDFITLYDGIGFVYQHDSHKDLAEKIKILFKDRILLEKFQIKGRLLAQSKLNWESEKEKWYSFVVDN